MPRSIMVVRTVPGIVACIQFLALKPDCEISGPSAFTSGAALRVQPLASVHELLLDSCSAAGVWKGCGLVATGREKSALLVGMVEASCGARYPAWARVCTGQGLEASSNSTSEKSVDCW